MPTFLGGFLDNLARYWPLTALVVAWPLAWALVIAYFERRPGYQYRHALYLSLACYLGSVPVPEKYQPRTAAGAVLMFLNRLAGILAFAFLICAFVDALDRGKLP